MRITTRFKDWRDNTPQATKQAITGWLFAMPILIFYAIWVFAPIIASLTLVFFEWNGLEDLRDARFVGTGNVEELLHDPLYKGAFINTFKFAIVTVLASIIIGLILALIVHNITKYVGFIRAVYYLPVILPSTAIAILWTMIYQPRYGLFNQLLSFLDLPNVAWLVNPSIAIYSVSLMVIWKNVGWYMVILLGGLKTIPLDYYEAAQIDGANGWQRLMRITMPLLRPTLLLVIVIAIIDSLQVFTPVYIMTGGGPGNATNVVVLSVYNTVFQFQRFGYGTTQTFILFLAIVGLTIIQLRVFRRGGIEAY